MEYVAIAGTVHVQNTPVNQHLVSEIVQGFNDADLSSGFMLAQFEEKFSSLVVDVKGEGVVGQLDQFKNLALELGSIIDPFSSICIAESTDGVWHTEIRLRC